MEERSGKGKKIGRQTISETGSMKGSKKKECAHRYIV
jgi:hypothetical protein